MTGRNGLVLYKGPSVLNGEPIVVIATGLQTARRHARRGVNAKTGAMVQMYILAGGADPVRAHKAGRDAAVCGSCIHRQGSCYVRLDQGPLQVWRAYQRGRYRQVSVQVARAALAGLPVRLGAYGDPAAVPTALWSTVLGQVSTHTGYTHQWASCDQALARWCMASCDTAEETDDSPLVDSPAACPLCGGEVYRRHRAGDGYLPECCWWECEQCGEVVRGPE